MLDVGGESTRPGADAVPLEEELRRVLPVVEGLAGTGAAISIDTSKAAVAAAALDAGASYVNDVTAFRGDPELAGLVADRGVDCCLMHMLGTPRTMQDDPRYDDVVSDVKAFLEERLAFAVAEGIAEERVMLDPGIGFGKTIEHNLELLAASTRSSRSGGRSWSASRASRSSARSPAASAADGPSRPPPRTCSRSSAGRPSSASTTSPRRSMRSRWRLLRWRADGPDDPEDSTTTT